MPDIFGYNRNPKPQGVFSSSESYLKFGDASGNTSVNNLLGALVQNWNVSYQNNVTEIFELGSDAIYWIKGRPTGSGAIARIIAFSNVQLFPNSAYDACLGGCTLEIQANPGACPNVPVQQVTLSCGGCIVTQIGFDASVADTRINEGIAFRFATMSVIEQAASGSTAAGASAPA